MIYTLDAKVGLNEYRLTERNEWRQLDKTWKLKPGDKTLEEYKAIINILKTFETTSKVKSVDQILNSPTYFPRVHRSKRIFIPVENDLRLVIGRGDDTTNNLAIITLDGYFSIVPFNLMTEIMSYKIPVITRSEILAKDGEYVGPKATETEVWIRELYSVLLAGLYEHTKTGKLNIPAPLNPPIPELTQRFIEENNMSEVA